MLFHVKQLKMKTKWFIWFRVSLSIPIKEKDCLEMGYIERLDFD